MSFPWSTKSPSECEAQCPDCGVTLSRLADMNRHRKTKHPDGSEAKLSCPWAGCRYQTMQKGNLKSHLNAIHSSGPQYPCPECNRRFSDAAARTRHRKRTHGYVPHHTKEYIARKTSNMKERVVQGTDEVVSSKSSPQLVTHAAPDGFPDAPPYVPPFKLPEVGYHDDFWKVLVDLARSYDPKPQPQHSQDLSLMLPYTSMPGYDAPNPIQPYSMQPTAPVQPFLTSSDSPINYFDFLGPQLDAMLPQEPSFEELFSEDYALPDYNELLNALPQEGNEHSSHDLTSEDYALPDYNELLNALPQSGNEHSPHDVTSEDYALPDFNELLNALPQEGNEHSPHDLTIFQDFFIVT